jgi:hypothetical protein
MKKLEGNGLWESSRMMLPEHKSAINRQLFELQRRERIELDEQERELINQALADSLQQRNPIALKLFHPIEELNVIGVIDRVDVRQGRFAVDGEWFWIIDIERVL